ncbi:MAG: hypothetical protein LBI71_05905 [Enterobacteriaceae bacterium]|nr:hypothetical protein [Enterobacteriaceae bacterium]
MQIQKATEDNFPVLLQIWEASVRATHDFFPHAMIDELRPLILNDYLPNLVVSDVDGQGNPFPLLHMKLI